MSALSLTQAKTYLNLNAASSTSDDELEDFIDAAEAAIEAVVGPISPREITATIAANSSSGYGSATAGYNGLILPLTPALSVTSITPAGGSAMSLTGTVLDGEAGLVTVPSGFAGTGYSVVYQAGRDPVPADLMMAIKEMLRHLWLTQRGPTQRPGSPQSDALANTLPGAAYALPIRVMQLLGPHTSIGFA